MSSNASCPDPTTLADFQNLSGLPNNVSIGYLPIGRNRSHEAMTTCCSPYSVNIADGCNYWCEQPTDGLDGLASCLSQQGMGRGILGLHKSGATSPTTRWSLAGLAVWILLGTSALHL